MVGFASVSNFNRHFRSVIRMTPREYRSRMLLARQKKGTTPGRPSWNSPDGWSRKPIPLRICAIVRAVYYL